MDSFQRSYKSNTRIEKLIYDIIDSCFLDGRDDFMAKTFSNNIKDLLTSKAKNHITDGMIDDIHYFMINSKASKAEFVYDNKILHIIKTECGGAKLYLEIDGKTIDMIP